MKEEQLQLIFETISKQ